MTENPAAWMWRLRVGEAVDGLRVDKEGVPVEWLEGRVVAQDREGAAP